MIKLKVAIGLFATATLVAVATPLTVLADSTDQDRITAQWESIDAPSILRAVNIDSTWHAAGEMYFRVDNQADVAAYSLSLAAAVDRRSQLQAVDDDDSAIPRLGQISFLVLQSNQDANHGRLTGTRAAAYQVAIWHLTDDLPINPAHVPAPALRSAALDLVRKSTSDCARSRCNNSLSTAATSAALSVKVGKSVDDTDLRIAIITPITQFFNNRQYVDLRINGFGASVCPGETDRIRIDQPVIHNVLKSSCALRAKDPTQKGDATTFNLPRLTVEPVSSSPADGTANNIIQVLIPRQDSSQLVQMLWPFTNSPGMILMPEDSSSPVITASTFTDTRTTTVTIDPDDFLSFQKVVQQSLLPFFTTNGYLGLLLLALLLVFLLALKDWVIKITDWLFGNIIGPRCKRRWMRFKEKHEEKKIRRRERRDGRFRFWRRARNVADADTSQP